MQWEIVILVFVLGATTAVGFWLFHRQCGELRKLSAVLNGKVTATLFPPTIKGEYEGAPFEVNWLGGSEYGKILRVALFYQFKFQLEILKKGLLTGWEHAFYGKNHLPKTPHHTLGANYAVYSNEAAMANVFLRSDQAKQAIKDLFDLDFQLISIDGQKIYAEYKPTIKWESGGVREFFFGNVYADEKIKKAREHLLKMIKAQ